MRSSSFLPALAVGLATPSLVAAQPSIDGQPQLEAETLQPPPLASGAVAPAQAPGGPPAPDSPAGPLVYRPSLPGGTPEEQVRADPAAPITNLVQAIERAYWSNPQILAERARTRSVDFRLPQARGQYGPQFQYSASYGYEHQNFEQPLGASVVRAGWTNTASAVLSQPLFTFGRLRAGEDSARAEIDFSRNSLRATEQDILFSAIASYASVLRDRGAVNIAAENVGILDQELRDTRARFDVRESTLTDLEQVRSRFELSRAQALTAQRSAASSEASFLRFVGAPAGELAQPNPLAIPVQTLEEAYAYAEVRNPVVASAFARERISRASRAAARADLFPRIGLEGRLSTGQATATTVDLRQTEARGAVTISGVLDSGVREARLGEATAANDADWRLIDATLRENRAEVANAWNEWQTQSAAVERLRTAAEASEQALNGALLQERAGLRTTLEVLELARDLLQARSEYNAVTSAAFVAQARLLSAMGALDLAYLTPDGERYDPSEHFDKVRNRGNFPLLTDVARTLDSLAASKQVDRPLRDPAAALQIPAVQLPGE